MKKAYFAGGCFWCIAAAFAELNGVEQVIDGYAGGDKENPTYLEVKHQQTNHRETVCVVYDEDVITYDQLLDFFFDNVNPFDPDGQFIDKGFSYTLAAFYINEEERLKCVRKIDMIESEFGRKVCISLEPYKNFYKAEEEHQNFAQKNKEAFAREYEESGRKAFFEGKK